MHPAVRFALKSLVYWAVALVVVSRVPALEEAGIRVTVAAVHAVLRGFGLDVTRSGAMLALGSARVLIASDCSPHVPILVFAGAVLAFPAAWRARLAGIVLGTVVLMVFNVVRISALLLMLAARKPGFDFVHVYLWQTGTVLALFATFALWLRTLDRGPRAA